MSNVEELERALAYPWDRWSVFGRATLAPRPALLELLATSAAAAGADAFTPHFLAAEWDEVVDACSTPRRRTAIVTRLGRKTRLRTLP